MSNLAACKKNCQNEIPEVALVCFFFFFKKSFTKFSVYVFLARFKPILDSNSGIQNIKHHFKISSMMIDMIWKWIVTMNMTIFPAFFFYE